MNIRLDGATKTLNVRHHGQDVSFYATTVKNLWIMDHGIYCCAVEGFFGHDGVFVIWKEFPRRSGPSIAVVMEQLRNKGLPDGFRKTNPHHRKRARSKRCA